LLRSAALFVAGTVMVTLEFNIPPRSQLLHYLGHGE
jgi:hypothetical protein